jgi:hypothetical protein
VAVKDIDRDKTSSVPGVFAAGDVIYGTKSVVMAVESGREAASQIDLYLGGDGDISEHLAPEQKADPCIGQIHGFASLSRAKTEIDPAAERQDNMDLFDHGFCKEAVCGESERCLQCDLRLQISAPRTWNTFEKEAQQ